MNKKPKKDHRKILGNTGEKIAEKFLKKSGFKIREKNYKNRYGEIDIIAVDGDCLVFVEVKTKSCADFSEPETWVDFKKQNQLIKMANFYLSEKEITDVNCRFDVIGITLGKDNKEKIVHIENAFQI
ncbi:MAG: YraN family protein [Candidatus Helarchaeota archaeon]|nr:YraN family protein [Candidatus Helarchaeota archaeon]